MSGQLGARAVRGTLWLGLVNLVSKGSQVVVTLVLAAFLTEGGLGAVALAVSLVNIGQVVQSMGVYEVISRADGDPRRVAGTVLTLSVAAGALLAVIFMLTAQPLALLLGTPQAAPLLRLAALSLPFSAAGAVQLGLMHRDLDFRRRMLPDAGSAVLGAAVTVLLAAGGAGPPALVLGLLCTAVAQPVLGALVGVRPRPGWDRLAAGRIAGWIAVVGPAAVVAIVQVNADYLAIGHVLGPGAVGVYSLAYRIAWVPYLTVAVVLGAVAFPVCVRLVRTRRRDELLAAAARFTRATLVLTGGLYLVTALLADRLVLLGERWAPAAAVLVPLSGYGLGFSLLQTWYQVIKAAGHARRYLALEVTHLVALGVALGLFTRHGIVAVAVVQAVVAWLMVGLTWLVLIRLELAFPLVELVRMAVGVLGAAVACVLTALALTGLFRPAGSIPAVLAEALLLVLGYAAVTLLTHRGALRELRPGPRPHRSPGRPAIRVVHVTQPVEAGVAAVVLQLAIAQRDRGWSVGVVCPPSGWLAERARAAGIEVHAWSATREPGPRSVAETVRLRRILRRLAPDLVHLHSSKAGLAGRLAVRGRLPTIFQPHLWSFQSTGGPLRRACAGWERFASRWTHQLVCVSDDELAAGRAARVTARAEVVCNGVDTERLRPGSRQAARRRLGLPVDLPTAVCVGRLAPLKGQDQLLSAWPAVLAEVPRARLVLVGDGPMGAAWRAGHPVARHESVRWWGHGAAVADFYAAADVVVVPSRAEGMALVPLEAMACARPVVAFDVGGIRQSVADAGAVVPAGDVVALAAAVAARLADPALAAAEGWRGRHRADYLFHRDRVADQIAMLVDKLVSPGGTR